MSYIKILRLKSGEDIIGFVNFTNKSNTLLKIKNPTVILIQYDEETEQTELLMRQWLPISLIETDEAEIGISELQINPLEVNKKFKEYYLNYLDNFTKISEEPSEELMNSFLQAIDPKTLGKVH